MTEATSNDNDPAVAGSPAGEQDAAGHAAILLVESLIHGLVARAIISVEQAIEMVDVAVQVIGEIDEDAGGPSPMSRRSAIILEAIGASLAIDSSRG